MSNRLPGSRTELAGAILSITDTFATFLGFLGAINHSETCYVCPGLCGCVTHYQVALFAPLCPVSAIMIVLGAIVAFSGITLIVASSARELSHKTNRRGHSGVEGVS